MILAEGGVEDPECCSKLSISQDLAGRVGPSRSSSVFDPSSIRPRNVSFADETVALAVRLSASYSVPAGVPG